MSLIHGLLVAIALLCAVPSATLLLQALAARPRGGNALRRSAGSGPRPRLAVLVPAHDEAAGLPATLASIRAQLLAGDRLLVVADNCTDDTAAVARAAGASVVERRDPSRRGKGYALDFGVRALERDGDAPEVVVVVDADCLLDGSSLDALSQAAISCRAPCQAAYVMQPPSGATLQQRISAFAWIVRNIARPAGSSRLGWPVQLMGTGMGFLWPLMRKAPLASGHLVEDLELGIALAIDGTPPRFVDEAGVRSTFPTDAAAAAAQRTRWEHGHVALIAHGVPRLLKAALSQRRPELIAMALDLAVPPLASLVAALVGVFAFALVPGLVDGRWTAAWIAVSALGAVALAIAIAWRRFARTVVSAADLAQVPAYVAAKLPMYLRLFVRRQTAWIRTRR